MDTFFQFLALIICLALSAFFSCSETALFSLSKSTVHVLSGKNERGRTIARHLVHAPNLLITILIGNMFVNIFSTSISERIATNLFSSFGLEISIAAMTFLIIIFGEITPKVIAVNNAQTIALFVIPFIDKLYTVLAPIRKILYRVSSFFLQHITRFMSAEMHSSHEEVKAIITDSHRIGLLLEHEKRMIEGVMKLNSIRVHDIMTPRTEMVAVEENDSVNQIQKKIQNGKVSRIPVYKEQLDNVIGVLYVKDFLMIDKENMKLAGIVRKPYFVPETKLAIELFREMRKAQIHLAVVVDEYGGVEGLITMEDILEEIFGDILDKKDVLLTLKKISPRSMKISGKLSIEDFNEVFSAHINDELNVTIGGFLLTHFGHIPKKGECIVIQGIEFMVTRSKKNRIEEIIVTRKTGSKA
ncbi:MAG: HlyC/CorC family transporter [Candidatus Auribacter fodinae]|uniref:HlyC/CorC family transporter n=1 Tax=Candidatus Auribacter fodinae TaxID=2093366 RepID=A0A3A4R3D8_9BACT|nr:MAG: HlyC/CorC family transporter [Candidatus Auribacter fodinae]